MMSERGLNSWDKKEDLIVFSFVSFNYNLEFDPSSG